MSTKNPIPAVVIAAALSLFLSAPSPGQVVINGTETFLTDTNPAGTATITYVLANPGISDTLVVGFYNDNVTIPASVSFDGTPAAGLAENGRTVVAYAHDPDASVDITITVNTAGNDTGLVVYELSGVDTETAADLGTGSTITTSVDGSFVINFTGINFGQGSGTVPAPGSIIPAANAAVLDIDGAIGGGAMAYGYGNGGSAGSQTLGWSYSDGAATGEVSIAFTSTTSPDSDGDGLLDVWEELNFGDLTSARGTEAQDPSLGADWDNDSDGFDNEAEETAGSDPNVAASVPGDIDGDGWADSEELVHFPNLSQDPDGDFDGDLTGNRSEADGGTSPADANDWPDTEPDNLPDGWELANGLSVGVDDSGVDDDLDGASNLEEFEAGSDPQDPDWTPDHAVLAHRWSFTDNLEDSVGGSTAQVVNEDPEVLGDSSFQNVDSFTLLGGNSEFSDYLSLGSNLLSGSQAGGVKPVTIELWATQDFATNWSRIFAFGTDDGTNPGNNESLRMTWTQGTDLGADQVAWNPAVSGDPGNAPYVESVPYHIVMTIVPALHTGGALSQGATVTWYSGPAQDSQFEGHPLYGARGSFNSMSDLRDLLDSACTLGRSFYGDDVAGATYDEVRIWKGALTETERELFHLLGPDNIDRSDIDNGGAGDGFPDEWELARFGDTTTAMVGADSDGDGENDELELANESDPAEILSTSVDVDYDELADSWERQFFNNLLQTGADDPDEDFVDNSTEEQFGTDPTDADSSPDTDGDGIDDGWEFFWFFDLDTADSTLRDGGTDTNQDGDLDTDLEEFNLGTDPTDEFSGRDSEPDGLPDYWECLYFEGQLGALPACLAFNGTNDPDLDNATNADELADGTDPTDGNDFVDTNGDGVYDGSILLASDGFNTTSFNTGLNWDDEQAPVLGRNYLVPTGVRLRTPPDGNVTEAFAGSLLVIGGELGLKGDQSIWSANYALFDATGTPRIYQIVSGNQICSLDGTIDVQSDSEFEAMNGPLELLADVLGSAALNLIGPQDIIFASNSNTYSGDITMTQTANLVVDGNLSPGAGSVFRVAPGAAGVSNAISGFGTIDLAGSLEIDLSGVVPSVGATWDLVSTTAVNYDPGFMVTGPAGFTADGGAVGSRLWTDASGNYQFDEVTGQLSFVGTLVGYDLWVTTTGLTPGVDDGAGDNPDFDAYPNILEYQLNGDPVAFDGDLVTSMLAGDDFIFTFERSDASEADSTLQFLWGPGLPMVNVVPVGAVSSGPDADGVVVTVTEDGGSSADYDLIEVRLPRANAVDGKLFGGLEGTRP